MMSPVMFVARWQYDAMLADLRARGLPDTHEQLVAEAEKVVGPCRIEIYSDTYVPDDGTET